MSYPWAFKVWTANHILCCDWEGACVPQETDSYLHNCHEKGVWVLVVVVVVLHYPAFILVCYYTEQERSEVILKK